MMSKTSAKSRRPFWTALTVAALLASPPARAAEADAATENIVTIDNFAFTPNALTVKAGTKVTFVNHDDIPHSIVASDGQFHSKALDTDDTFVFTFAASGSFGYFCGLHPHMTAKIVVVP